MNNSSDTPNNKPQSQTLAEAKPTTTDHKKPSTPKQKSTVGLWLFCIFTFCMSAGTLTAGWFIYQQQEGISQQVNAQNNSLQAEVNTLQQSLNKLSARVSQETPWQAPIESLTKKLSMHATAQQQATEQLEAKLNLLLPSELTDWQLSQLEFYLLMAQKRLSLTEDSAGAAVLLEEAIHLSEQIKDPDILGLTQAMTKNRAALKIQSLDSSNQLVTRLQVIVQLLLDLNISPTPKLDPPNTNYPNQASSPEPKDKVLKAITESLVRVVKLDEKISPMANFEHQKLNQQQLIVLVSQAQLYILNRNHQGYQETLESAINLIDLNLNDQSNEIKFITQELNELLEVNLKTLSVNLKPSISAYQEYIILRKRKQSRLKALQNKLSDTQREVKP